MLPADSGIGEAVKAETALIRWRPVSVGLRPVIRQLASRRVLEADPADHLLAGRPLQLVRDQRSRGVERHLGLVLSELSLPQKK